MLCRLNFEAESGREKKKSDREKLNDGEKSIPAPSRSEIVRESVESSSAKGGSTEKVSHIPDAGKDKKRETRSLSIKDVISEEAKNYSSNITPAQEKLLSGKPSQSYAESFSPEKFGLAFSEFTEEVKDDGPRVASMFKSVKPEVHPDNKITLHMSNVDQSDLFTRNYKQRLLAFLEKRFGDPDITIEAKVDMSETNGIIYSDEQKYNFLVSRYPSLKEIRKTFNLDFDYR